MGCMFLRSVVGTLALLTGINVSQAAGRPDWYPSDEVVAARTKAIEEQRKAALAYYEREFIGQYKKFGYNDATWDEQAIALIRATIAEKVGGNPDAHAMRMLAANKCVAVRPQDSFIVYLYARTLPSSNAPEAEYRQVLGQACAGLSTSGYARTIRFYSLLRQAELAGTGDKPNMATAEAGLAQAVKQVDSITKDKDLPSCEIMGLLQSAQDVSISIYGDRWKLPLRVYTAMVNSLGERSDLLTVKADLFTQYAWDARGDGWASTVTDEGWKLMKQRLEVAEGDLNAAWKKYPQSAATAITMMAIELGQGKGNEVMETWFRRAVALAPNERAPYESKRYYLEAKWHGSDETMMQFAREVSETVPRTSELRMIVWDGHAALAHTAGEDPTRTEVAYFKSHPDAWPEIRAVADDIVFAPGTSNHCKAEMTRAAVNAGDFATARKYMAVTDEQLAYSEYGMEFLRFKAAAAH